MNVKKRRNKNRSPLLFRAILIVLVLLGGVTAYAALVTKEEKPNEFAIGNLETKIDEVFERPQTDLAPGIEHPKLVQIFNSGNINQVVRVMIEPEILTEASDGESQVLPAEIDDEVLLDINDADWDYGDDGYYYYVKETIKPQQKSTALFTKVELASGLDEIYDGASLKITLKVEAASTGGDKGTQFGLYQDVWWNEKPTDDPLKTIDQALQAFVDE